MKLHGSIVVMGSVDYQDEGLRPNHVQEAQAKEKTNTTPVAASLLVPQVFVASVCQCSHQVPEDLDLLVLIEPTQDFSDISQDSATANDRYLVSKTRMQLKRYSAYSDTTLAELQQFDGWSFGRRLTYARNT